jgi:protein-serine/threonine kinase
MASSTTIVRKKGHVLLKDSGLRSFIWSKRFLQLRDQMVTIHKNEVTISDLEHVSGIGDNIIKRSRIGREK